MGQRKSPPDDQNGELFIGWWEHPRGRSLLGFKSIERSRSLEIGVRELSIKAVSWALNEAPVEAPVHVLILVAMAERCHDDGTEARQSAATIASKARVSQRTVQRELKVLEQLGVIRRGDQSLNGNLPANRRPVVYDLALERRRGDNLSYQDSDTTSATSEPGFDTTSATSSDTTNATDTTSTTVRYDIDDTLIRHGCRTTSPITSPITSSREVPHQCEHGYDATDCALCLNPQGNLVAPAPDVSRQDTHWRPSPAALEQAKQGIRLADINLSITTYEVWCKRKGRTPNNGDWLSWVLRDEKDAREAERERARASRKYQGWAHVEE